MRLESLWMFRGLYAGTRESGVNIKLGGWAMGMPMLFVLNELMTKYKGLGILEFGSGQSTKFIAAHNDGGGRVISKHVVYEHDASFASEFQNDGVDIRITPVVSTRLNSKYVIKGEWPEKINVILVDGPFGASVYSRTNILEFVSQVELAEDWVIIIDDVHRPGERMTERRLIQVLRSRNFNPIRKRYEGEKIVSVITEKGSKFQPLCQSSWFL